MLVKCGRWLDRPDSSSVWHGRLNILIDHDNIIITRHQLGRSSMNLMSGACG